MNKKITKKPTKKTTKKPKKSGRGIYSDELWRKVKEDFDNFPYSFKELSIKYGIPKSTISSHADAHNWDRKRPNKKIVKEIASEIQKFEMSIHEDLRPSVRKYIFQELEYKDNVLSAIQKQAILLNKTLDNAISGLDSGELSTFQAAMVLQNTGGKSGDLLNKFKEIVEKQEDENAAQFEFLNNFLNSGVVIDAEIVDEEPINAIKDTEVLINE